MAVVLVVDDEFAVAKLLEDVLTDEGHRVLVASNGRSGLGMALKDRPDVVLTDFMMPVMDGVGLIEGMAAEQALKDVPVIVMSAMPEASIAARCSTYRSFVRKPFKILDVIRLVTQLAASPPDAA